MQIEWNEKRQKNLQDEQQTEGKKLFKNNNAFQINFDK